VPRWTKADTAQATWDSGKKVWQIRIKIGEEVIKRPAAKTALDVGEDVLRSMAVKLAQDEGYDLDPSNVTITR
jgi:hypothetical protein